MSDIEVREIASNHCRSGRWKAVADLLKANPGKSVFVPGDGYKLRPSASSLRRYVAPLTVSTRLVPGGLEVWIRP